MWALEAKPTFFAPIEHFRFWPDRFNLSVASVLTLANNLWWSSFIVFVGGI